MAKSNRPLLERMTQNPLLISVSAEQLFQSSVAHVVASEHASEMLDSAISANDDDDFWSTDKNDWRTALRPYNVKNGVLQIPVMGVLLNRFPYQFGRWATGYAYIEKALERGMADGNVRAIAFVHDSPGGEVAGCFECVDKIYGARGQKPIRAFVADHSYSASYANASAADDIVVTRSGGVGSIGVVTAHVEYSKMLNDLGIKITFIFAGDHKVDGNAYEKLPESVKSRIQKRIDKIYGVFTSTVARNRKMDEQAVRDTEALTYDANEAIDVGLADRVGSLEEEMVIFSEEVSAAKDEQMATENTTPSEDKDTVSRAEHEAATAQAARDGAKAERARIKTIMDSDVGKARPKAARATALGTDMTVEQAESFLSSLDEEKAETPKTTTTATGKTPFEAAMEHGNPEVGGSDGGDESASADEKATNSILTDFAGMTGRGKDAA